MMEVVVVDGAAMMYGSYYGERYILCAISADNRLQCHCYTLYKDKTKRKS